MRACNDVVMEHLDRCVLMEVVRRKGHWSAWYSEPEGEQACVYWNAGFSPRFLGHPYGYPLAKELTDPCYAELVSSLATDSPNAPCSSVSVQTVVRQGCCIAGLCAESRTTVKRINYNHGS